MSRRPQKPVVSVPVVLPTPLANEEALTPEELASKLKLPPETIYQLTRKRSGGRPPMPKLKAGKFLRFKWSAVMAWMENNGKAA